MKLFVRPWHLARLLNAYENRVYGPDFAVTLEDLGGWTASPFFFWSCCSNLDVPQGTSDFAGSLSILLTSKRHALQLIAGERKEQELEPWNPVGGDEPAYYFCSYTAFQPGAGRYQFAAALAYFGHLRSGLPQVEFVFGVAATQGGARHLCQAGMGRTDGWYKDRYPIQTGLAPQLSLFWRTLCGLELLPAPAVLPRAAHAIRPEVGVLTGVS